MRLASRQFGVGLPVSLTPPLPSALWQGTHLTEKIFLPTAGLPFGTGLAVSVESANAANAAHAIAMLPPQATKRKNARRAMWRFPLQFGHSPKARIRAPENRSAWSGHGARASPLA